MAEEAGVNLLLHAWFSRVYKEGNEIKGAIFESKSGRQAILSKVFIDCTGDGDVFASAGEDFRLGKLPLGLVFRVGNVNTDEAESFIENPANAKNLK